MASFQSSLRSNTGLLLLTALLFQGAAAQVGEQDTTVLDPTKIVSNKPKVDCSVTWSTTWTKCSPEGTQSRRYTVDVYPTRTGKQCPAPEVRSCTYSGPQTIMIDGKDGTWGTKSCPSARRSQERKMLGYVGETHESFMIAGMCQYDPIQVTVGDVLVFKKAVAGDDVFALASQWHYAECDFSDGGAPLAADATSSGNEVRYTIRAQDKNKRLYLASSRAGACKGGQRVLVSVDDFKQGTLAEALHLIDLKTYETDEGARHLIERIWCFEDHCPTPAMGWYEGNAEWAKARCVADAYSLLGFVYRKKPSPELQRAEKYYKKALELVPQHCEATSYMGEFYLQTSDLPKASDTYLRLEALADTQKSEACKVSLRALQAAWNKKGWCPPADANSKAAATPCAGQASAAAHLSSQASGLVLSALLLLLAAARA